MMVILYIKRANFIINFFSIYISIYIYIYIYTADVMCVCTVNGCDKTLFCSFSALVVVYIYQSINQSVSNRAPPPSPLDRQTSPIIIIIHWSFVIPYCLHIYIYISSLRSRRCAYADR